MPEAAKVIMDVELSGADEYYRDRMLLLTEEMFEDRINILMEKINAGK